jgi:hypothetical protein
MESILGQLSGPGVWEEFLADRLKKGRFNWHEFDRADTYVSQEEYLPTVTRLLQTVSLSVPTRHLVNKMGTGKKRVVYSFPEDEMNVLKVIAFLLYRYDSQLSPNCYSFRRNLTAHNAVRDLIDRLGDKPAWAYKMDIHDYFNSISIPILLPILSEFLKDDEPLFRFFETMLTDGRAVSDGAVIREERGVMAGTPTSPFLADVYLTEVDRYFEAAGVVYARYSDDIILFAPDRETLDGYIKALEGFLQKYRLEANPDKVRIYEPGEPYDFLGFKCLGRDIDIADATRRKMKGKISRKTRSLMRWRGKEGVSAEAAMKALIRSINSKFFENDDPEALTWSRWFFPMINKTEGLKEIDHYLQENLRYLATGKHNKANYRIRYDKLKELGYRSLVHEFYEYKKNNDD